MRTQENTWSYLTRNAHLTEKVLWYYEPKLPTRLKQVKTDMIKQKTIIRHASTFHFGKSPFRLASPQQLL